MATAQSSLTRVHNLLDQLQEEVRADGATSHPPAKLSSGKRPGFDWAWCESL
ncbi:MAG: hypothetical protein ACFB0C_07945 [Leptolyngbyaceae cyanobacterium]